MCHVPFLFNFLLFFFQFLLFAFFCVIFSVGFIQGCARFRNPERRQAVAEPSGINARMAMSHDDLLDLY